MNDIHTYIEHINKIFVLVQTELLDPAMLHPPSDAKPMQFLNF